MTAAEARKRSEEYRQAEINSQVADLMYEVEMAIKKGEMSTTYYNPLNQQTIDYLEREPNLFKINSVYDSQDRCTYYEISW